MVSGIEIAGLGVILVLAVIAVLVAVVDEIRLTQGSAPTTRRLRSRGVYAAVAVAALLLLIGGLAIPVFLAAVVANIALGERENVPFSWYKMFSSPSPTSWTIRLEDEAGEPVHAFRRYGIPSSAVRKRYAEELRALRSGPAASRGDVWGQAGVRLLDFLDGAEKPESDGGPIRVVRVELSVGRDGLIVDERVVADGR